MWVYCQNRLYNVYGALAYVWLNLLGAAVWEAAHHDMALVVGAGGAMRCVPPSPAPSKQASLCLESAANPLTTHKSGVRIAGKAFPPALLIIGVPMVPAFLNKTAPHLKRICTCVRRLKEIQS